MSVQRIEVTSGSAAMAVERPERVHEGISYEPLGVARSILIAIYVIVAVWYLAWRPSTFNPNAMAFSVVLYVAEAFGFVIAMLHVFMLWRLTVRTAPPAPPGLTVDLFVTTVNEPVTVLRRTLLAAVHVDYPHQTWLLDDGNRPEMRELAEELGCRYLARSNNVDYKAGNLNNALRFSQGEFVAVFDADHAPARDFLKRTLGYFRDTQVAFVQTPQDFYNLDSFQHRHDAGRRLIWTEQSLFFRVIQRGKDYWNAAFFCGSCAVLRRKALDEVQGFATGTVTEDLLTSIRLHRKGFKSVYHSESLAFGIAPSNVVPFLRQRVRWGQGAMQALRSSGIFFGRGFKLPQRLCYLASVLTYFDGWQKAVFYFAPVIVLTTGVMPIAEMSWVVLAHFLPFYILTFWVFEETGRGFGRTLHIEQYNMARFAAFVWATVGLVRRNLPFQVTAKHGGTAKESRRMVLPQALVFLLNAVAIPLGVAFTWSRGDLPTGALIANVVWAAINVSLASAVIRFATRLADFRRRDYRFPIPVPARLEFAGSGQVSGVVDDISSQGFKFYGRFPPQLQSQAHFAGQLYLPSGKLPFQAEVKSLLRAPGDSNYVKAIGCSFDWSGAKLQDGLDAFLYGSDLQWRINRLGERARTPLESVSNLFKKGTPDDDAPPLRWTSALVGPLPDTGETAVGLLSIAARDNRQRTLIAFEPLPPGAMLPVKASTRMASHTLKGRCELEEVITSCDAPLYVYRFHLHDHQEVKWANPA